MKNKKLTFLRRMSAFLLCVLALLSLSVTAFAAEGDMTYTTEGGTWVLVSEVTDEATGIATKTYGMDTNDDGKYEITLVQNGSQWDYYFTVTDETAKYYVTELLNNGLGDRYTLKDENGNPLAYAIMTGGELSIYNVDDTYRPPESGSLKLSKVLDGSGDAEGSPDTIFAFDVTLSYGGNAPEITGLLTGFCTYGNVSFTWAEESGSYTAAARVYLKAGESVEMTGIPAGVSYSVTELEKDGYALVSWSGSMVDPSAEGALPQELTWSGSPSGTIEKDREISVTCTNERSEAPPPGPGGSSGSIVVKKTVRTTAGAGVPDDETGFSYRAVFGGLSAGGSYSYTVYGAGGTAIGEAASIQTMADGSAVVDFTLKNGERAVFEGLPVGCTYQILEYAAAGYTASYEIENFTGVASSRGENFEDNQNLTTGNETLDEEEANKGADDSVAVHFINTVPAPEPERATVSVTVNKVWEDADRVDHTGDEVTVYLMQAASLEDMQNYYGDMIEAVILDGSEDAPWEFTFADLDLYQDEENTKLYYYYVQEQELDGYHAGIESHYVTVKNDANEDVPDYTQSYSFTITNRTSRELPMTGGAGTALFTPGGLAIAAGALVFGCGLRRRRERRTK